jgi:hypothetical protein
MDVALSPRVRRLALLLIVLEVATIVTLFTLIWSR